MGFYIYHKDIDYDQFFKTWAVAPPTKPIPIIPKFIIIKKETCLKR
jgi:hypothetical protein